MHIIHKIGDKKGGLHRVKKEQMFCKVLIKMWIFRGKMKKDVDNTIFR
jgi:hypothetical protein